MTGNEPDPSEVVAEAGSSERLAMLKRLAAATAFAVPVVTSFSMDGLAAAPSTAAGQGPVSPWRLSPGLGSAMPFRAVGPGGAYMWMPSGSYVNQFTGDPTAPIWASTVAAGATGLRFELDVLPSVGPISLYWRLFVPSVLNESGVVAAAGHYSRTFTWSPATTTDLGVSLFFTNSTIGAPLGIDNVTAEGLY